MEAAGGTAMLLPVRGVYSVECNTLRKLFPRLRHQQAFSVLVYAEHLANVFEGVDRAIGDPPLPCTEDTDLIAFLKGNLFMDGYGHFAQVLKDSLANPLSIGVVLGVGRFQTMDVPQSCRFANPRWCPKVVAHAKRLAVPRPLEGSMTLGELELQRLEGTEDAAIDVDAMSNSACTRPDHAAVQTECDDVVQPSPNSNRPDDVAAVAASEAECDGPARDTPRTSMDDLPPIIMMPLSNVEHPPTNSSETVPATTPAARTIELQHIDICASLLNFRKYISPAKKRPQPKMVEQNDGHKATQQRRLTQQEPSCSLDVLSQPEKPQRKPQRHYHCEQAIIMTRRQRRALELAEEAENEGVSHAPETSRVRSASGGTSVRDKRRGRDVDTEAPSKEARRERIRRERPSHSSSNPTIFHVVDVAPGKRPRSLLLHPDFAKRKKKRKPQVVIID